MEEEMDAWDGQMLTMNEEIINIEDDTERNFDKVQQWISIDKFSSEHNENPSPKKLSSMNSERTLNRDLDFKNSTMKSFKSNKSICDHHRKIIKSNFSHYGDQNIK